MDDLSVAPITQNYFYTRNLNDGRAELNTPEIIEARKCPKCKSSLLIKTGRYGKFIGCSAYPKCKHIEPLKKPLGTGVQCPECKKGSILKQNHATIKYFIPAMATLSVLMHYGMFLLASLVQRATGLS